MAEDGGGEANRLASCARLRLRQVFPRVDEVLAGAGAIGDLDSLRELLEGQASGEQVVAERRDRPLAIGVGDGNEVRAPMAITVIGGSPVRSSA